MYLEFAYLSYQWLKIIQHETWFQDKTLITKGKTLCLSHTPLAVLMQNPEHKRNLHLQARAARHHCLKANLDAASGGFEGCFEGSPPTVGL